MSANNSKNNPKYNLVCKHCRYSWQKALLEALIADLPGVSISWNPARCPDGTKEHEWIQEGITNADEA